MRHALIQRLILCHADHRCRDLRQLLEMLWRKMGIEGKLDAWCPTCDPEGWGVDGWLRKIEAGARISVCVERNAAAGNRVLGFIQLEGLRPRRAFFHFCWFNEVGLHVVAASRWVCGRTLALFNLDVLVGMIPATNVKAIKLAERTGFEFCGFFPKGSYVRSLGRSVDTAIYCYSERKSPGLLQPTGGREA